MPTTAAPDPPTTAILSLEPPDSVLRFLRYVLRPIVRIAVLHGVRLDWLVECIKQLLVEEVLALHPTTRQRLADATASMLTGVHRVDVKRIRTHPPHQPELPSKSVPQRVLEEWTGHPLTVDRRGAAKPLPRLASVGGDSSFEALVRRVSTSVTPRSVLDALLREGTVTLDEQDRVHFPGMERTWASRVGSESNVATCWARAAETVHDDICSVLRSRVSPTARTRSTVYGNALSPKSLALIGDRYRQLSMQLLLRMNQLVTARMKADQGQPDAVHRVRVGVYLYDEAEAVDAPPPAATKGSKAPQRASRRREAVR
jgi:hypothetical protein